MEEEKGVTVQRKEKKEEEKPVVFTENVVLVLGATGKTGQNLINQLADKGWNIRVLVRNVRDAKELLDDILLARKEVEYVQGSLPKSIPSDILQGVRWIIYSAASTPFKQQSKNSEYHVGYLGIKAMIELAKKQGKIERFVLVSSLGVTRPFFFVTLLLNTIGNFVMKWKLMQENELRQSGLPYVIIRPGGLTNKLGFEDRVEFVEDKGSGQISREAVADVCIRALSIKNLPNATVGIIAKKGTPLNDEEFEKAFAAVKADSGTVPVPNHELAVYSVFAVVVALVSYFIYFFFFR